MKMSYSILSIIGILVVVVMFSGCGFRYFDPQYYEFKGLAEKESGFYIVEAEFFDEFQQENFKNLSNGYRVKSEEITDMTIINSRICEYRFSMLYFIDSSNKKHIISYYRVFRYKEHGLWLRGDEGRGFWWQNTQNIDHTSWNNVFYYNKENGSFIKGEW
ncbi:hypothetical protein CQA53_11380 [Helicobacter didelphidarum]|uniref:Lipoprotein n=2 Tax=Helicobacter didelphidarum TaxID=2040648 RepID=A0A3D8I4A7_9HELI|nr:hypothetical protein CQA53_11380 [Helicobacter didelphidarum]